MFRSIRKCTEDLCHGIIQWENNWITFLDGLLQLIFLKEDTRNTYVPISIGQILIDAPKHIESCAKYKNAVRATLHGNLDIIRYDFL